jgi:predicted naringenin-chalcone synthase
MTYEEMEKTMQFILEKQAQIVVQQQQAGERVSLLETNMAEMARSQVRMAGTQADMAGTQVDMAKLLANLARSQAHMNEVAAAMLETHKHTEEKLDAFIGVLERYISEGRNGNSGGNGPSKEQ